jgi:mannose-6-phosphate isomerase-like protein (cupin superfamily)
VLIRLSKGACTRKEESPHGSEKFVYLLDGKIEAVIGSEKYPLGRNDSLYFASNTPHYFRNTGNSDASLIVVCCPSS